MGEYEDISLIFFFLLKLEGEEGGQREVMRGRE